MNHTEKSEYWNGSTGGEYTADWQVVATHLKNRRRWRCEVCKFQKMDSSLIQVHHIDGDKLDNSAANLQVLCAVCHGSKHGGGPLWPLGVRREQQEELKRHHRLR